MLIDSDFKDYYDPIQCWGIDKSVVYPRKTTSQKLDKTDRSIFHDRGEYKKYEEYRTVVGFCGKLYPLIHVKWADYDRPDMFCYTKEGYEEAIGYKSAKPDKYTRFWYYPRDNFWAPPERLARLFQEHKTPIFRIDPFRGNEKDERGMKLTLNPRLKDLEFQHVVDPATAFQQIYLYISGVLGTPLNPTVVIDDKHKAIAHGHDGEYSFKKPPGGGQWR